MPSAVVLCHGQRYSAKLETFAPAWDERGLPLGDRSAPAAASTCGSAASTMASVDWSAFSPGSNAKNALQEWCQARGRLLPRYELASESGPPHAPRFVARVTLWDGRAFLSQEQRSVKEAHKSAAAAAMAGALALEEGEGGALAGAHDGPRSRPDDLLGFVGTRGRKIMCWRMGRRMMQRLARPIANHSTRQQAWPIKMSPSHTLDGSNLRSCSAHLPPWYPCGGAWCG